MWPGLQVTANLEPDSLYCSIEIMEGSFFWTICRLESTSSNDWQSSSISINMRSSSSWCIWKSCWVNGPGTDGKGTSQICKRPCDDPLKRENLHLKYYFTLIYTLREPSIPKWQRKTSIWRYGRAGGWFWIGVFWHYGEAICILLGDIEKAKSKTITSQNNNAQLIIPISTFFNYFDDFTMLAYASKILILDSISNNFSSAKTREVMQQYSRVQVTSIVLRLAGWRIKHFQYFQYSIFNFQYLRLTHIDLRMAAFKARACSLACMEKQAVCGLLILNSIPGNISLSISIFVPNQYIRSIGGEIVCCVWCVIDINLIFLTPLFHTVSSRLHPLPLHDIQESDILPGWY